MVRQPVSLLPKSMVLVALLQTALCIGACGTTSSNNSSDQSRLSPRGASGQASQKMNEPPSVETGSVEPVKKSTYTIDPLVMGKAKPLFEAIVKNDEKKAKLAYGRAVRALPEIVQIAVDLRLKNYDHAGGILTKTPLSEDEKTFWGEVISKKPKSLETAICKALMIHPNFPSGGQKAPDEEAEWLKYYTEVVANVTPEAVPKERSDLTKSLDRVICTDRECGPIPENLQEELLTDKFFDDLHNMRRRDTRFYKANYKSPLKLWQYRPLVSDIALFKFYKALKNTTIEKQNHFLRRFRGIARDMRSETILSRSIGAIILGDEKDRALAKRFGNFLTTNSLITALTRIEGEIATCEVPESAPPPQPSN